jgi:hypothetical protein
MGGEKVYLGGLGQVDQLELFGENRDSQEEFGGPRCIEKKGDAGDVTSKKRLYLRECADTSAI